MTRRSGTLLGGVLVVLVAALAVLITPNGAPRGSGSPGTASPAAAGLAAPTPFGAAPDLTGATGLPSASIRPPAAGALNAPLAHAVVATRIVISRLGIDLPIVEGDGVDTPLYKIAHYPGTAWPGGGSNIYLYGHARAGMFLSLWNAKVGDVVVLDLANGAERTYVVNEVLPDVPWNDMRMLAPTTHEQLTLQTCTSYAATAPRFVVIAIPQS